MAYNINKSNSDPVTIPTGAIDNQFDIPLIGQDAINYGDDLALAFVRLLENFAADNAPAFGSARTSGQLWYDTTGTGTLNVYDGTSFVAIPKASEVVDNTSDESIAGDKTFSGRPAFNGGTSGVDSPFDVDSTFLVTNLNADQLDGQEGAYYAPASSVVGTETTWVSAADMQSTFSNGAPAIAPVETTAGRPDMLSIAFDDTTLEAVQFQIAMPKRWDLGTVTYEVYWASQSGVANDVIWGMEGVAMGANETIDVAYGTAVPVTSGNNGIELLNKSAISAALTIGGTPGDDNMTFFRFYRDAADGSDTLVGDALLLGIKLYWTSDAATDD